MGKQIRRRKHVKQCRQNPPVQNRVVKKNEDNVTNKGEYSVVSNDMTSMNTTEETKPTAPCRIEREQIKEILAKMCEELRTNTVDVDFTEDTRKLDSGIVCYIIHVRNTLAIKSITRKTGLYFTRVRDRIHVQVINGTSMVVLFSNYSENSQTDVFKYLKNMIQVDVNYQNKPVVKCPARKEGRSYGRKG